MFQEKRGTQRINLSIPIQLNFGSQILLQGQIRDLSLKSAFIMIRSSIHMAPNDKITFLIDNLPNSIDGVIKGSARISRVVPGDGIAIYFIKIEDASVGRLHRLVGANS